MYCSWFFFFKQKTAYEMRISDWSSDVCSSDLQVHQQHAGIEVVGARRQIEVVVPHEEKVARRAQHLVAQGKIPQRSDVVAHHAVAVEVENLLHAVGQDLRNEDAQVGRVRNVSVGAEMTVALDVEGLEAQHQDRKRTRLNSSH